jgi:hypothetical protein
MTDLSDETSATELAELKKQCGKVVLATESEEAFDEMLARLMECFKPKDYMERQFICELATCTWMMIRYGRHGILVIERQVWQYRVFQARRIKIRAERRMAAERDGKPTTELDRMLVLDDVADGGIDDVDTILNRPPEELEYSRALEKGLECHERIGELRNIAVRERNDVLRQLELYRAGLGKHLRQASDAIIVSALEEADPQPMQDEAPLVPPAE